MPARLLALFATAALAVPAVASADPAVTQQDSPCSADLGGAATLPFGRSLPLACQDSRWQAVTAPGDPSDRWVSFGPPIALHGEGLRNPNLSSGVWTATPLDPQAQCAATQHVVVSAGVVGPPVTAKGEPGQPFTFQVLPSLFDITMTGHCLWTRTG